MRLNQEISFSGPIAEGIEEDEWFIGARSIREEVNDVLKNILDSVVHDEQEKVLRVDLYIARDDGMELEPSNLERHRITHMRGVPVWDYMSDKWVMSGTDVLSEILPLIRAAISIYYGTNATVYLQINFSIDESDGLHDLPEYIAASNSAVNQALPAGYRPDLGPVINVPSIGKTKTKRNK